MEFQLILQKKAKKSLNNLLPRDYQKVLAVLTQLAINPYAGKKLDGELGGSYSYRVWPYRIVYKIYKKQLVVMVLNIGHRQGVYK